MWICKHDYNRFSMTLQEMFSVSKVDDYDGALMMKLDWREATLPNWVINNKSADKLGMHPLVEETIQAGCKVRDGKQYANHILPRNMEVDSAKKVIHVRWASWTAIEHLKRLMESAPARCGPVHARL